MTEDKLLPSLLHCKAIYFFSSLPEFVPSLHELYTEQVKWQKQDSIYHKC
jgi:hypothetical protein